MRQTLSDSHDVFGLGLLHDPARLEAQGRDPAAGWNIVVAGDS